MTAEPLVYLETSVFIAHIQAEEGRVAATTDVIVDAKTKKLKAITSAFTACEVVKIAGDGLITPEQERRVSGIFDEEWLRVFLVDRRVADKTREVVREFGLKPPDAVHVATALLAGATMLFTYDKDHLITKLDGHPTLRACFPFSQQGRLFAP